MNNDNVKHPSHYTQGGIECIKAINAALGNGFESYCIGNVMKYIWRYKDKNGAEDLRKAMQYLEWAIEGINKPCEHSEGESNEV